MRNAMIFLSFFLVFLTIEYVHASCVAMRGMFLSGGIGDSIGYTYKQCCDYCDANAQFKNHKTSKTTREYSGSFWVLVGAEQVLTYKNVYQCYCPFKTHQLEATNTEYRYIYNYYRPLETSNANMSFTEAITLSIVHLSRTSNKEDTTSLYAIDYLTEPTEKSGRLYVTNAKEIEDDHLSLNRETQYHEVTKVHNSIYKTYDTSPATKIHMYEVKIKASEVIKNAPNDLYLTLVHATQTFITLDMLKKNVNSISERSCQLFIHEKLEYFKTNLYHIVISLKPNELCTADVTDVAISMHVENTLRIIGYEVTKLSVEPTNFTYTANGVLIKIDRLFIHSHTELTLVITPTNNTNGTMSKLAVVFGIFTASVQVDNEWISYKREMEWSVYLSNVEQDNIYHIMDEKTGFCLQYYSSGSINASKTCSPFLYIDKALKYVDGACITADSSFNLISDDCSQPAAIDFVKESLQLVQNQKFLSRKTDVLGSTYLFNQNAAHYLTLKKVFNSGLQTKLATTSKVQPRVCSETVKEVSFLLENDIIHYCSHKSSGPNCLSKDFTTNEMKIYPKSICLIIGFDSISSSIYGLDSNGNIIQYDNFNKIAYDDIMESWELVKLKNTTMIGQVYEETDLFHNPSTYTINDVDYNLTYSGLRRLSDQSYVMNWLEERCWEYVAKLKSDSFESCLAIKNSCPRAPSGWYWLHGRAGSHVLQGYCEMNTDGGGWLLFVNYTLSDGQHFVINKTDDLSEMLKPQSYPTSKVGLQKLVNWYVPYTSMRFYCFTDKPGRTLHFKTLNNDVISPHDFLFKYLSGDNRLTSCSTYQAFQDDNSIILKSCSEWKDKGYWGDNDEKYQRLYVLLLQTNEAQWNFGHGESSVCDSLQSDYTYGEWKIFLR